jgi:ribosomal-protein-alanine N-acetyltransferase
MLGQAHAICLAATDAGGVLRGYAAGTIVADEAEVLNLAVAPAFRRRGVARALLAALLDALEARGARSLFLEVRASNSAALALYRAFGFRELGRRIGYYRAPHEDAITMVKDHSAGTPKNDSKLHEFG